MVGHAEYEDPGMSLSRCLYYKNPGTCANPQYYQVNYHHAENTVSLLGKST